MAEPKPSTNVDPAIFQDLQNKIDEEGKIRDELKEVVKTMEQQGRQLQSILSRMHNTPTAHLEDVVLKPCQSNILEQVKTVGLLSETASKYPFYKWNSLWQREIQNLISSIQLCFWLADCRLTKIDDVGTMLNVPVNLKDRDAFHITIEDYLIALTNTVEELARLAPNAVTLGDFTRPLQISKFIKDVHAGFQLLNLKNDILRRKSDGIKYNVKKVEDVVYDLSLRGLLPKTEVVSKDDRAMA